MKIILCTGMMRSGSTWSFNVSRLLAGYLASHLRQPTGSGYLDFEPLDNFLSDSVKKPGVAAIKAHAPTTRAMEMIKNGYVRNICTIRDPRDCVASHQLFEKADFETSVRHILTGLKYVSFYQQSTPTLFIRYEDMMQNRMAQIGKIAEHLDMNGLVTEPMITEIDRQTNMESSRIISDGLKGRPPETLQRDRTYLVDPVTGLHENHIHGGLSGRWKSELTDQQRRIVLQEFSPWLVSLGYETQTSLEELLSTL